MPLAHSIQRRQDVQSLQQQQQPQPSSETPSPSASPLLINSSSYSYYNNHHLLNNKFAVSSPFQPPPALDLNYSFSSNDCYYTDSRQSTPSDRFNFGVADTPYMQNGSSQYPQLRVQQSASNGLPSATTPPPMVEDFSQQSWNNTFPDNAYLAPSPQNQYNHSLGYRTHKRLPSDSSVASVGPDSPYTQSTTYPRIVDPDVQSIHSAHLETWDHSSSNINQYPKSAFAQSSNSDLFYNPALQNFNTVSNDAISMISTQTGMGQIMNQQHGSNVNGTQNTSRRRFGGGADASSDIRSSTPQLDRTMSDVFQDELYNPAFAQSAPSSKPRQQAQGDTVSPHRNAVTDLLQVANTSHLTARSASPAINISRQRSPFRESSQYAVEGGYSSPSSPAGATRLTSAAQLRQQQKFEADAHAFAQHHPPSRSEYLNPPKTISPKEAHLDYHSTEEDARMPLFPQLKHEPRFSSQSSNGRLHPGSTDQINNNDQPYSSMKTGSRDSSSSSAPQPSAPGFATMAPSVPAIPQQYPFISESRRQSSSMRSGSDQVPEFPASLTSMESTKSETGQPEKVKIIPDADLSLPSSQEAPVSRPANTTAASGTYTCTTPDCHARFDAAAKLHKHRKEAHRASSQYASAPTTPTSATNNAQAAANSVSRNNSSLHKCEKVNPQTSKPCNTVFSRSYDLTRHDDTIHNSRKQKARCSLCTEEKTFSRSDALTRHMRVVHPDVEFPGKSRRGRNEGVDIVRQRIETGRGGR